LLAAVATMGYTGSVTKGRRNAPNVPRRGLEERATVRP